MEKYGKRERGRQGVKHGGNVYSGGERLGDILEILADSARVSHVDQHGENYWTKIMRRKDRREDEHC